MTRPKPRPPGRPWPADYVPATPVLVRVPPELLERVDEAVARLRADGWTGTRTALILDAIRDYLTPSIRTR